MTRLFGFIQLELPGTLAIADGRYVVRDGSRERVLVLETLGAPPPPRRRRRRARVADTEATPPSLPLSRATVVRAFEPFDDERRASAWLTAAVASEGSIDELLAESIDLLNRALHAQAVASADPRGPALASHHAVAARLGYGSGEEVASGEFTEAREVDARAGASKKRQRDEELRPQQRLAAVLGGHEQFDACEVLLLRARADLDAGRSREAALQLRIGLEALLAGFSEPPSDPGHDEDMSALKAARHDAGELASAALRGEPSEAQAARAQELIETCERVIRRRRILRGA
ncbi:MAG: hypothetical protein ACRDLL_08870 [Solirubrobacterales bacterium]